MTIEWHYEDRGDLGVLSVAGFLGVRAAARFTGAVGWVVARGSGPVILDLTELHGWSAEGQLAIRAAAGRLADRGRALELAAIPADGSLVPDETGPTIPVHHDLPAALAAHQAWTATGRHWRTTNWPTPDTSTH
ncbi:anti-sigma factor antagonist [Streptomyces alkaliterrae]|uniref:Anti-sigma factor antagonist n=1 Tax=Streptomyces alkaliterrae TaxID=2213162 RepID=A0A5P0YLH8_9ACTN|nr:anti-sigma factor antagonist [Streptomyces alkaliterrae]MBB1251789.1 anti-sigma factor antagonist [Streptomyces alkaliterrae]MBB1257802.1 anti-sigma factor antagonist [Streptomyces alkaliterrae]MQS01203.1 anti-sigma factor antagonist [Streptomyces alkaliterrae]